MKVMEYKDFVFYEDYYIALKELVRSGKADEANEALREIVWYGITGERANERLSSPLAESIFRQCKTRIDISYKRKERREESFRREPKKRLKSKRDVNSSQDKTDEVLS